MAQVTITPTWSELATKSVDQITPPTRQDSEIYQSIRTECRAWSTQGEAVVDGMCSPVAHARRATYISILVFAAREDEDEAIRQDSAGIVFFLLICLSYLGLLYFLLFSSMLHRTACGSSGEVPCTSSDRLIN